MSVVAEVAVRPANKDEGLIQHQELKYGEMLDFGGFGIVYHGAWRMIDVAIKELIPEKPNAESAKEFKAEAQTMKRLRHPNIVQFYGYCMSPRYCIVMEYMPQGSLYDLLYSRKDIQWELRIRMAIDMARGLLYLHEENIIHRDIKSPNVLLNEHFEAKITDFGLAKVITEGLPASKNPLGTPGWMAPELGFLGAVCTKKSDIYSLGITFWELASRQIAF